MSERLRRDEIPEREGLLQRRELQIVCKGPSGEEEGKGTRSVANPGEGGILPVYLPTTFRSHFTAKFSVQIVNVPMHIVCIPAGHFHCIHRFRTVGDSNPALIINDFRGQKPGVFTDVYETKIVGAIFASFPEFFFLRFFLQTPPVHPESLNIILCPHQITRILLIHFL